MRYAPNKNKSKKKKGKEKRKKRERNNRESNIFPISNLFITGEKKGG